MQNCHRGDKCHLVDEYRLLVFPTILGAGKRLFGEASDAAALRLVDAKPAGETLILHLRTKREIERAPYLGEMRLTLGEPNTWKSLYRLAVERLVGQEV